MGADDVLEGEDLGMIIACGFVSSGTRLLHGLISEGLGLKSVHRSYPHWDKFWHWTDYPADMKWVVIHRRPDVAIAAAHKAGHPGIRRNIRRDPPATLDEIMDWWDRWMKMAASIPDAYWLSYEALVADPDTQIGNLARHLGGEVKRWIQIRDENAKWLDPAPS